SAPPAKRDPDGALPWSGRSRCSTPRWRGAARSNPPRWSRSASVALPRRREAAGLHGFIEFCDRVPHDAGSLGKGARELRMKIGVHPEQILKHQVLAVGGGAGADSDDRDATCGGDTATTTGG